MLHSHVTMVTRSPHPSIKGQCVLLAHHHGYLSVPAHQRTTCFTHTSPWLPDHQRTTCFTHMLPWLSVLIWASKDNLFCPHVTMDTCPHLGIKGQPIVFSISPWLPVLTWTTRCFLHITMLTCPHQGIKGQPVFFSISPWLPVLTLASKENLDTGMFSGPPWTSKCLQPALAST